MKKTRLKSLLPLCFLLFGLTLFFYPSFESGFETIISEREDGRINHFYLEHAYGWLRNADFQKSLLYAPYHYPLNVSIADNENLLGTAPIYALFRFLGLSPAPALVWWGIDCVILNFVSMYWLLRGSLHLGLYSSSASAWFFAFCAAKAVKFRQLQFVPEFYLIFGLICLLKFLEHSGASRKTRYGFACLSGLLFALQFYSGMYLGWFFVLIGLIYMLFNFLTPDCLAWIGKNFKYFLLPGMCCLLVFLLALLPLFKNESAMVIRPFEHGLAYFPSLGLWTNTHSIFYRHLDQLLNSLFGINIISLEISEENFGIGAITLVLAIIGLFKSRDRWIVNLAFAFFAVFVILIRYEDHTLWFYIWKYVPFGSHIRAAGRAVFILLIIYSIGLAFLLDKLRSRLWIAVFSGVIILENAAPAMTEYPYAESSARTAMLVRELEKYEPGVPFVWAPDNELIAVHPAEYNAANDAVWAAHISGHPTLNGFSPNRQWKIFPIIDPANPEWIYDFDLVQALEEPFILITGDFRNASSRLLPPPSPARKMFSAILRRYKALFDGGSVAVLCDESEAADLRKALPMPVPESVQPVILEKGQDIALAAYENYDYVLVFGENRIIGKPFLTLIDKPGCRLLANRLKLDFIKNPALAPLKASGLSGAEETGRWSDAREVVFAFPSALPRRFRLEIEARAIGPNAAKDLKVVIGDESAEFRLDEKFSAVALNLENPKGCDAFKIIIPQPVRPIDLKINQDKRTLGVQFREMTLAPDN